MKNSLSLLNGLERELKLSQNTIIGPYKLIKNLIKVSIARRNMIKKKALPRGFVKKHLPLTKTFDASKVSAFFEYFYKNAL